MPTDALTFQLYQAFVAVVLFIALFLPLGPSK